MRSRVRSSTRNPDRGADGTDLDLADFDPCIEEHGIPEETGRRHSRSGSPRSRAGLCPRFEKVEREEPADGVVIEGDDL
jgi:hypothetical protein